MDKNYINQNTMTRTISKFISLRQPFFGRTFLLTVLFGGCMLIITILTFIGPNTANAKKCFHRKTFDGDEKFNQIIKYFEDVLESSKSPTPGKTIFFHETSCSSDGLIRLNGRQACAIESAAKLNPNWDVFVLSAAPVGLLNDSTIPPPKVISALLKYPNIHFRNLNLWTYALGTPLEDWFLSDILFTSQYLNSHVSDFLRYLSLYKYGGTYMDLDVVVQKNLDNVPPNYAGAESPNFVAAGVINFEHNEIGHEIAELCVREFYQSFDGNDWGNNGPGVITRVLKNICRADKPPQMTPERCLGFKVYPPSAFYAVPWPKWDLFFDTNALNKTLEMTKDSIVIHVWNKHSIKRKLKVGALAAYGVAAAKNCPTVYNSVGEYF